ncbi:hypothetical protein [Caenispirillum salinarum]|uniref:hypothetical protein n=1 Tax=Caenispirillum salinarum TaxID=859058 RepID=UPI00384ADB36
MRLRKGSVLAGLLALTASAALAQPLDCLRVPLTDIESGAAIVGPEDLAFHSPSGTLYISAHDRAGKAGGGLYALPAARLEAGTAARVDAGAATFPHGIALDDAGAALAVIDHRDRRKRSRLLVFPVGENGRLAAPEIREDERLSRANDVAPDGQGGWLVTIDRGSESGLGRLLEVAVPLARAKIIRPGQAAPFADGLAFANGIVRLDDGRVVVAETRADRLTVLTPEGTTAAHVPLNGPPDNLAVLPDGRVAVAVLTGGLRLMLSRQDWLGFDPPGSRVVAMKPHGTGPERVLFDDPDGTILAAATSAVAAGDRLVIGSVADSALAVCPLPAAVSR